MRRFFSEAPVFFIAVVVGIALTFRVAIGWAKSPSSEDAAKDPTLRASTQPGGTTSDRSHAPIPVVTAEPSTAATAATATVPPLPRKKPRPRR